MLLPQSFPVTCHTSHVGKESIFVAINGFRENGSRYIQEAIERGASTIIHDERADICGMQQKHPAVTFLGRHDLRKELALLSAKALDYPADKLGIIGVTGTKGKTTTVYLVVHMLRTAGYRVAMLSSIENSIEGEKEAAGLTTPSADYLHMFFKRCVEQKIDVVLMEVSSHALSLSRVHGISFIAVGFTNLSSEHMDYHKTMIDYFETKYRLFNQVVADGHIICNIQDKWGKRAFDRLVKEGKTPRQYSCKHIEMPIGLFGEYNKHNVAMAMELCKKFIVDNGVIKQAIATFPGVSGRLQKHVLANGACAYVDFAHSPSAVEAVLKALRSRTKHLIVVLGCGGDRDKTKRPVMGKIAGKYGDAVIVTSDNPRTERAESIINQIYQGIDTDKQAQATMVIDRREAIEKAATLATSGSIVAVLGKGHEKYQIIGDKKFPFDDFKEISKY